jgi:hypothetical protein
MLRLRNSIAALVLVFCVSAVCWSQSTPSATTGFDKLKMLVGEWEGTGSGGHPVQVSYRLVSGGSALMETMKSADEEMVTVYHRDKDAVMMTHYCAVNNQPRMRSTPKTSTGKQLAFELVGVSNLATPASGHMQRLVLMFDDDKHITQQWMWKEAGKEKTDEFHLARKG